MNIVIFGGKGFIGTVLTQKAEESGHTVRVFDLTTEDIRNPGTFVDELRAAKPDVVINLAAILGTMKQAPSIQDLFETNVMGNLKVLRASYDAGVRNYVFVSSMTVHGENKIGDHRERLSPFNPKHGYSASKAAAEFSMMQFLKEAPEVKIVTVRPTMVLGAGTYLPHAPIEFIKTVLAGKDIELFGEGKHEREWVWLHDVATGILKAVEYGVSAQPGYSPFFLSAARIAMGDLAARIAQKLGGKVTFVPSTAQAFTLTSNYAESQSLLGWHPQETMDSMIDRLITILRDQTNKQSS